jgi:hypothetical protein
MKHTLKTTSNVFALRQKVQSKDLRDYHSWMRTKNRNAKTSWVGGRHSGTELKMISGTPYNPATMLEVRYEN